MKKSTFTLSFISGRIHSSLKKTSLCSLFVLSAILLHAKRGPVSSNRLNNLSIGGAVWAESDNNGMKHTRYDGANLMDAGLIGVTVNLYADNNNDGLADGPVLASQPTNNYGQYTFASLAPGNYVVGVMKPLGNFDFIRGGSITDPDNNVDEDNNGVMVTATGELRSLAITLTAGSEPTYDGDDANSNRTLDFAFDVRIGISDSYANCTVQPSTVDFARYGYGISARQSNTTYPYTYFSYAYQYQTAAGNWVCFTEGLNTINGAQVMVTGTKGTSVSSIVNTNGAFPVLGNIPSVNFSPAGNNYVVPVSALQGLVVRCVISHGQNTNACALPAGNTFNSSGQLITKTIDFTTIGCRNSIPGTLQKTAARNNSMAEDNIEEGLHIFPNPATGPVQLEFNGLKGTYIVNVFDQSGRLVNTENVYVTADKQYHTLNRRLLSAGNYLVQVRNSASGAIVQARQLMLQ